jgi:hypothetical protein
MKTSSYSSIRQLVIALLATGAAAADSSLASGAAEPSSTPPPSGFTQTGSLEIPRWGHTATLLLTGEVLVTGGGDGGADETAELYNPGTGSFSPTTGHMTKARREHTATLLSNANLRNYGKVLIVGSAGTFAELYDPVERTFAATGSMHQARTSPTATLLNSGKVLVVGGDPNTADLTAELYDPASETFSYTGSTTVWRSGHTATFLIDGSVLIAGGTGSAGPTATAEVYSPSSGTFKRTIGNMTEPRTGHTATLLGAEDGNQDGRVLIIGTNGLADLYNPTTETFTRVGSSLLGSSNYSHTASLINDQGAVLVAGGYAVVSPCGANNGFQFSVSGAELFAWENDGFTVTAHLNTARDGHTATVLADGITVLIVGGTQRSPTYCTQSTNILSSAELFQNNGTPAQQTPTLTGYCIVPENTTPGCIVSGNPAACPAGQAAIDPTTIRDFCNTFPTSQTTLDRFRGCVVKSSTGVFHLGGHCLVQ